MGRRRVYFVCLFLGCLFVKQKYTKGDVSPCKILDGEIEFLNASHCEGHSNVGSGILGRSVGYGLCFVEYT